MFLTLYRLRDSFDKMFYIGSGAEFNKSMDIINIKEKDEFRSIPDDPYGFAKYIEMEYASRSANVYNLRLFGCYGPTDHYSKFITHAIRCCLLNSNITIRQDCLFDYIHVHDFGKILKLMIPIELKFHSYNICSGSHVSLIEIAEEVKTQMHADCDIVVQKIGMNKEYTGCNERMLAEIGNFEFKSIKEGISEQIQYEKAVWYTL